MTKAKGDRYEILTTYLANLRNAEEIKNLRCFMYYRFS